MLISEILLQYETDKNLGHEDYSLGHCYGKSYDRIFQTFQKDSTDITILEIGVQRGGSLCAWKDYFINGLVIGVDITDSVLENYKNPEIEYIISDIKNEKTIEYLSTKTYDIIIDDGSHFINDVMFAVKNLSKNLKINGYYIIEDCQSPEYWLNNVKQELGPEFEISFDDIRQTTGRYDDFLIIIKKTK